MSALLTACSLSGAAATPTGEPQLTQVALDTPTEEPAATRVPPESSAMRFRPLLLTLEDFPEGIVHSAAPLTDNTKKLILANANFSDAFGYGFEKAGSDFLGGVTGFLDDESLILEFDDSAEANIVALLAGFSEGIAGPDGVPLTEEDQQYVTELPAERMPEDARWGSEFVRVNEILIRLDLVAFRRGNVGVYLIYVSSPAREPLLDIAEVSAVLEERILANLEDG
jgi:hypothetical protein